MGGVTGNKPGRPVMLDNDPEKIDLLFKALQTGAYLETAIRYAGISKTAIYLWLKKGHAAVDRQEKGEPSREDDTTYVEFMYRLEKAMAESEMRDLLNIANAAVESWQASAWRLERRFPEKYGRRIQEVSGVGGGPIQLQAVPIDLSTLSEEELGVMESILERQQKGDEVRATIEGA